MRKMRHIQWNQNNKEKKEKCGNSGFDETETRTANSRKLEE